MSVSYERPGVGRLLASRSSCGRTINRQADGGNGVALVTPLRFDIVAADRHPAVMRMQFAQPDQAQVCEFGRAIGVVRCD